MEPPQPGAAVFTSFAAFYLEPLPRALIDALRSWRPAVVVHFEPIIEHYDGTTLLGLLQRRYLEVNGYSLSIRRVLTELADEGSIEILEEMPALYGGNPLLPASAIAWRPSGGSAEHGG